VVETKDLTASFGWTTADAFKQHDVQELLRKLFEAMEITFKHGNLQDTKIVPVNVLYEGMLVDSITCQINPKHGRERVDPFFDLLLSIRDIDSLEGALNKYTEIEMLEEENKWTCEQCGTKVPAAKRLLLKSTPLFLTLQLKRFDYNYQTWQRIKLNNRVTFPMELDFKPWLTDSENSENSENSVYELFSVLIHSGGAAGGHYYAIIKNVYDGKWFKFNDSSVQEINEKEIELMYGERENETVDEKGNNKIIRNQNFSTNAYLLLYRKKEKSPPADTKIPDYITSLVHEENIKFHQEKAEWIKLRDNLPLDIHVGNSGKIFKLHIDKNRTVKDATQNWKKNIMSST